MRVLLLTEFRYEFSTFRLTLESLARAYRLRGHRVLTAGQGDPGRPRSGRGTLLGGSSTDAAARAARTRRELVPLLHGVDAVHLHTAGSWSPILGAISDACAGRRLLVTFQDWDNPALPRNSPAERRRWRALTSRAVAVTAVSRGTAARIARALPGGPAPRVVPNGIDDGLLRLRSRLPAKPFVLAPVRLAAYKGVDVLLFAWKDAAPPRVELVFCGADHSRGSARRLAGLLGLRRRVRFRGEVGRSAFQDLLAGCLFAVLPSRHESFGLAALEASAAGKAVLATRADGPRDVVLPGRTGLLAAPGSVASLRGGLRRLLGDPALRARLGRAGRRRARDFRWTGIAGDYLSLLEAGRA